MILFCQSDYGQIHLGLPHLQSITMVDGKKNLNTPWALYQLNVMVFWTLGMPVVNKFPPKIFLQKLPEKA